MDRCCCCCCLILFLIGEGKTDAESSENTEKSGGRGGRGGGGGGRGGGSGRGGRGGGRGGKSGEDEKKPTGPLTNVTITYTVDPYNGKKLAEASNGTDLQTNEAGTPVDKKGVPLMLNEDGTWSQQSNGDNALTAFRFQTSIKNSLCIFQFHRTMYKYDMYLQNRWSSIQY